jgi:hypothetical protein
MAYAISYTNKALANRKLSNYFCAPININIDSKLLIDIANGKLQGDHTSESVTTAIVSGLAERYPCAK